MDFSAKITCFSILDGIFVWETIIQNTHRNPIRITRSTVCVFLFLLSATMYEMESMMTIVCGCDIIFLFVMYCVDCSVIRLLFRFYSSLLYDM